MIQICPCQLIVDAVDGSSGDHTLQGGHDGGAASGWSWSQHLVLMSHWVDLIVVVGKGASLRILMRRVMWHVKNRMMILMMSLTSVVTKSVLRRDECDEGL